MKLALPHTGAILLAMLLQSCGGGSGDECNTDPCVNILITLTPSNALTVGVQGFWLTESAFQVLSLLSEATLRLHQQSLVSQTYTCPGGGNVTLSAQDRDNNGILNAGDRVNITYAACDGSTSGTLDLELTLVEYDSGQIASLHGNATFDLDFPNLNQTTLTGSGPISHRISTSELFWQAPNVVETLSIGGRAESARIDVDKTLTVPDERYTVRMSGVVDSASLGGRYVLTMNTPLPYVGDEHQWPESGQVIASGFNGTRAVYRTHDVSQGIAFYALDSDGDGDWDDLQAQIDWSELSNGVMFGIPGDRNIPPIPSPGTSVFGRRIALGAPGEGLAVDSARDRIYVTVPDRQELLVISAQTLEVVRQVELASRPNGLSLSADAGEIFVALGDAGSIAVIDADTFAVSSVFVATGLGNSGVHKVVETAPGVLYAAIGNPRANDRVVRIDRSSGSIMPVTLNGMTSPEIELLADRGRGLLYVADGLGDSAPTIHKYDTDPQTAFVRGKQNRSMDVTHRLSIDPTGTRLYLSSGQILATSDFSQIGRITRGTPWASDNGTDVIVGTGEGVLHIHSAADLHEIVSLVTDCALTRESGELVTDVDRLVPSPVDGQWLLLGGDILCAVDLNNPTVPPGSG